MLGTVIEHNRAVNLAMMTPPRPKSCDTLMTQVVTPMRVSPGLILYSGTAGFTPYAVSSLVSTGTQRLVLATLLRATPSQVVLAPIEGGPGRALSLVSADAYDVREFLGIEANSIVLSSHYGPCLSFIYAFDIRSFRHRWHRPATDRGATIVGGAGVLALRYLDSENVDLLPYPTPEVLLTILDEGSGNVLWTRSISARANLRFEEGYLAITDETGVVRSFVPKTGKELPFVPREALVTQDREKFTARLTKGKSPYLDAHGQECAYKPCDIDLVTSSFRTGKVRHRIGLVMLGHIKPKPVSDKKAVYVETVIGKRKRHNTQIQAIDASSGSILWSTTPLICANRPRKPYFGYSSMTLTSDVLYACSCDGLLRAYKLNDGSLLADFGVGGCGTIVASASRVAAVIRPSMSLGLIDFEALPAPFHTKVVGHVEPHPDLGPRCPCSVRVGQQIIDTDATGAFTADIGGRGVYSAELVLDRPLGSHKIGHFLPTTTFIDLDPGQNEQTITVSGKVSKSL